MADYVIAESIDRTCCGYYVKLTTQKNTTNRSIQLYRKKLIKVKSNTSAKMN